jgi:hypothetical protein
MFLPSFLPSAQYKVSTCNIKVLIRRPRPPPFATAAAYCSNRVCDSHSCSESMNVGSVEACAAAVESNPNCGKYFSYNSIPVDGVQSCDCVPPGSDCGTTSYTGDGDYNTYSIAPFHCPDADFPYPSTCADNICYNTAVYAECGVNPGPSVWCCLNNTTCPSSVQNMCDPAPTPGKTTSSFLPTFLLS